MDQIALPECVVCLQHYDEEQHVPHVLSCGHSLCVSCVVELPTQWPAVDSVVASSSSSAHAATSSLLGSTSRPPGSVIRCPECNYRTRLPFGGPSGLPRNIELMRMVGCVQRWVVSQDMKAKGLKAAGDAGRPREIGGQQPSSAPASAVGPSTSPIRVPVPESRHSALVPLAEGMISENSGNWGLQEERRTWRDRGKLVTNAPPDTVSVPRPAVASPVVISKLTAIRAAEQRRAQANADVNGSELGLEDDMSDGQDEGGDDDSEENDVTGWACLVEVRTLEGHCDTVTSLVIYDGRLLSAGYDKGVKLWSLEDGALLQTLDGHPHRVMALAIDHESKVLFSGDYGGQIFVWDLADLNDVKSVVNWQEHNDWRYTGVSALLASGDGLLYSGSGDRTIKAWNLQDYSLVTIMEGHKALISSLHVDGEVLYSGSWDGSVRLWWRSDHTCLTTIGAADNYTHGSIRSLSGAAGLLFVGRDSGAIQVWKDEECLGLINAHTGTVAALCVGGNWLYSASWDKSLKAWQLLPSILDSRPEIVSMGSSSVTAIVAHDRKLYGAFSDGCIKVYREIENAREMQSDSEIFHCSA